MSPSNSRCTTRASRSTPYAASPRRDRPQAGRRGARLLAAIVASSDDAIVSKTLDGHINSWNKGAEKLFGYAACEAVGQHIGLIIPPERLEEERHIISQLKKGRQVEHYETSRRHKDGRIIDVALTVSPIEDAAGNITGASTIARDITDRKEAEARLERYMQALERSNKELDDFAYIASHDLKEPLRGIYNHARFPAGRLWPTSSMTKACAASTGWCSLPAHGAAGQ